MKLIRWFKVSINLRSSNYLILVSGDKSCIMSDITSIMFFFLIMISLQLVSSCIGVYDSGLPIILISGEWPLSFKTPVIR